MLQCVAVCCSMLQCVAVCCGVLQCVAPMYTAFKGAITSRVCSNVSGNTVCCSALQCISVCCSVLHPHTLLGGLYRDSMQCVQR